MDWLLAQASGIADKFGPRELAYTVLSAFLLVKGLISIGVIRIGANGSKRVAAAAAAELANVRALTEACTAVQSVASKLDKFPQVVDQVAGLYRMHDKTDDDGVPVWYVRQSLEAAIRGLKDNILLQNQVIAELKSSVTHLAAATNEHNQRLDIWIGRGCPAADDARKALQEIKEVVEKGA